MLNKTGWITATILAMLIFISGLGHSLIYPIAFLILGSLISKLNPKNNDNKGRNAIQVIANAGVAGLLSILYLITNNSFIPIALVISFSIALSDTFSSEVGKRFGGMPFSICNLKPIQKGLSGGISVIGTLGGLLGSFLISVIYFLLERDLHNATIILLFGFLGMLVDSIIGCSLQSKYRTSNQVSETGNRVNLISGFHFIDNNVTNFLSILVTVIIYMLLYNNAVLI